MARISAMLSVLSLLLTACGSGTPPPAAPAETATPAHTATPSTPIVRVEAALDCNAGPGPEDQLIASFQPGDEAPLVGKDDYGAYWIVIDPGTERGCWVSRQGTAAEGNTDYLPNLVPGPTPIADDAPAAPANLRVADMICAEVGKLEPPQVDVTIVLAWEDVADNEEVYLFYRNGNQTELLDPDTTEYRETIRVRSGSSNSVTYGLEAYNGDGGASELVELVVDFPCE